MARSDLVQAAADLPWMDPLDAYLALRHAGHAPLLLASAGAHPEARWSFVALDPVVELRLEGDAFEERWADGAVEAGACDPIAYLDEATSRYRFDRPAAAPFTGGWVGFLGFGLVSRLEPTLPPSPPGGPDAVLRLCRGALAFDHTHRTARAFAADLDGDLGAATARLAQWQAALAQGAPAGEPPRTAGPWATSLDQPRFEEAVRRVRDLVHGGDLFQANIATRFEAPFVGDPATLLRHLVDANPSPYMALLEFDGLAIASGSPERLVSIEGARVSSRPIAGTRRRGRTPAEDDAMAQELRTDPKERAEHAMLVDLVRNDVARVALPGTVRVPEFGSVERYRHVMHLASEVEGTLRPGTTFVEVLRALFPGGTVTGAPKVRATQRILELEPVARGPYTGSAGYLDWGGNAAWSILIRTLVVRDGTVSVHAGSGIVAGSDPEREWKEARRKAQALLDAATGSGPGASPGRLGEAERAAAWEPPRPRTRRAGARVLLIDNYDSFVHNLADYFATLGAVTRVVRNDADWRRALDEHRATHVVLSPGPGWPNEAGCTLEVARELSGRLPLLGICLGHQAIGEAFGGQVRTHPAGPVHGRPDQVHHAGAGLFAGLPSPMEAARYHSLVVAAAPGPEWKVDAWLADGTVMALRHAGHPTYGLQCHPESLCTPLGLELLDRFLAAEPPARRRGPEQPQAGPPRTAAQG
jgi:anthranilate synthase